MKGLTQEAALGFHSDDPELMYTVQDEMVGERYQEQLLRPENPCHYGFVFMGFQKGKRDCNNIGVREMVGS